VRIADAPVRQRVKLWAWCVGSPSGRSKEFEALEVVLTDGTGWDSPVAGPPQIPGLLLGSRIAIEGVLGEEQGVKRMVNRRSSSFRLRLEDAVLPERRRRTAARMDRSRRRRYRHVMAM